MSTQPVGEEPGQPGIQPSRRLDEQERQPPGWLDEQERQPTGRLDEQERQARMMLSRLVEPGHRGVHQAVARIGAAEVQRVLQAGRTLPGITPRLAAGAALRAADLDPAREQHALDAAGGRLVCPGDQEWPGCLDWPADLETARGSTLEAPPLALFVRGQYRLTHLVQRSVAIVGARAATRYGDAIASGLASGLVDRGWSVISGGAYGIDAAAHRGALSAVQSGSTGSTVAVLACGVDVAYPRGNDRLLGRIAEVGLLVSELPPGSTPTRIRFLVRNRLIAALSLGTVVVQAAARSGSLSTLHRAGALGRHQMVVPGPVDEPMSVGCHQALREDPGGVILVTRLAEVLDCVGQLGVDAAEPRRGPAHPRDHLDVTLLRVLEAVPVRPGAGEASIAKTAGLSSLLVQQVLPSLHIAGLIERHPRGGWCLTTLGASSPAASRD